MQSEERRKTADLDDDSLRSPADSSDQIAGRTGISGLHASRCKAWRECAAGRARG